MDRNILTLNRIYGNPWCDRCCIRARGPHCDHDDACSDVPASMSWALTEFFSAVAEEFCLSIGDADDFYLETPGSVIDYIVENSSPTDGMDEEDYRDHVAGVIGEIMARTLGVTRYSEDSRFFQDLRVR